MRPITALLSTLILALILACGGSGDRVTLAGETHDVLQRYGRLIQIDVTGSKLWFETDYFDPAEAPLPIPPGDTCRFAAGDSVEVDGTVDTVDEVHGKMMSVMSLWYLCTDGKPAEPEVEPEPVAPSPAPVAPPRPSPNAGRAAQITQCKRGCNRQCRNAPNKAKCVGRCRRACDD
jgi:hypothetical protein